MAFKWYILNLEIKYLKNIYEEDFNSFMDSL